VATNTEQGVDEFWNFEDAKKGGEREGETEHEHDQIDQTLLAKYFTIPSEEPVLAGDTGANDDNVDQLLQKTTKPSHQRSESQSSTGLSIGTSSLLDSELDLAIDKLAASTLNSDAEQGSGLGHHHHHHKDLIPPSLLHAGDPEPLAEDDRLLRMFPKIHFSSQEISSEEWGEAKTLLLAIMNLVEELKKPVQLVGDENGVQREVKKRREATKVLKETISRANNLITSKLG
jgi:hypothetical protein